MTNSDAPQQGLKSAYEAALEKLETRGISRPDEGAISDATREAINEARRRSEAKLAELEIMHRDGLAELADPMARAEAEQRYRGERLRLEDKLERELEGLRTADPSAG